MSSSLSSEQLAMDLPITQVLPDLLACLPHHTQVVLQAEPGAGKSTQVPLALLNAMPLEGQKILMLEPRRLAAKRLAEFLAQQLGETVGQTVGYRVRNENRVSKQTRLEIITEGVLTRIIQSDPELQEVGVIIFDEFHERNLHADLGLTLLLEVQQSLREDLRCLIMSATLDEVALQNFLPNAQFLSCSGRSFPVEVSYHPAPPQTPIQQFPQLAKVLAQALSETDGDILLFLAGQGEILQAIKNCQAVCESFVAKALPLYGSLSVSQQALVFQPAGKESGFQRKVIFSTNIAETSITLQGITAVIDSGLEKSLMLDPSVGMSRLQLQRISQASATQRMGRAGRVQPGRCYRLWSETQQVNLLPHHTPEICRVDLAPLRMELARWGASAEELSWLTPPPAAHLAAAQKLLQQLQFLDCTLPVKACRFLPAGVNAGQWHAEPRFAKLLMVAEKVARLPLGCDLVALLQEGDPIADRQAVESIDIELRLQWLYQALQDSSAMKRLQKGRFLQWKQARKALYQKFGLPLDCKLSDSHSNTMGVSELLALAFPDRIGKQRGAAGAFKLANGRGVMLPANALPRDTEYLVAVEIHAQVSALQQNARVFLGASLAFEQVAHLLPLLTRITAGFDSQKQRVEAREERVLDKLVLVSKPVVIEDALMAQRCLLQAVQQDLNLLPWSKAAERLSARAAWLAQFSGFERCKRLSKEALATDIAWLEPYTLNLSKVSELKSLNLQQILESLLGYTDLQQLEKQAPKSYLSPAGREFAIEYMGKQAKVSLPLQQVFGELSSPKLAGGQVNLTFELLSPAQRPIQITADLANFWQTSYFEVAKEMRGRYPKHRWPEKPLEEKAGHSLSRNKPTA